MNSCYGGVIINYFKDNYNNIRLPYDFELKEGFRKAQIGAIHAIGSHYINSNETGIINMPTGSGKTAVIMLTPYLVKAERVLIITPSKLVRNQIYNDYSELNTLKNIGAFYQEMDNPKIYEVKSRITEEYTWKALLEYDVVISTPNSISPSIKEVLAGPIDMFDLVIVDEGHHSAAKTWSSIMEYYADANKLLFSATPFRRDKKEIKGKFLYHYSVANAYEDEIFGEIEYIPVIDTEENNDLAIAKKAEEVFLYDKDEGFNHRIMVRTDGIKRSKELMKIYEENTSLKLKRIDGSFSDRTVKGVIEKLKSGELDGVVCVNLMGEGFDLPLLKIAALHSPHKSLEVTLQFVGRFARVNAPNIGRGKFLAVESEIEIETFKLFEEGRVWQELIANLSDERVLAEIKQKSLVDGFEEVENSDIETADVSMYSVKPYVHAKVYQTNSNTGIDFNKELFIGSNYEIVNRQVNEEENVLVVIYKEEVQPNWTTLKMFSQSIYEIMIIYHDGNAGLLYVNTSRKQDVIYDNIIESISDNVPKRLSMLKLNRVLLNISNQEFFNIGMRNGVASSNTEAYRIMAGPNAQKSIANSDTTHFHRGHCFVKGTEGEKDVNIGYSSGSKIWTNGYYNLLEYKRWCDKLSEKIKSDKEVITHTEYDELMMPETVTKFPEVDPIVVIWDINTYTRFEKVLKYQNVVFSLTDMEINNIQKVNSNLITFDLFFGEYNSKVEYKINAEEYKIIVAKNIEFINTNGEMHLQNYLNANPFTVYFNDFTSMTGDEFLKNSFMEKRMIHNNSLIDINWEELDVDITNECDETKARNSIQKGVYELLTKKKAEFIFFDHGTGESADFVTAGNEGDYTYVTFYHCKSSGQAKPGNRVGDIYEVSCQAIKSMKWSNKSVLLKKLKHREKLHSKNDRTFKSDKIKVLEELFKNSSSIKFETVIVQPGITKKKLSIINSNILGAADDFIKNQGFETMKIWCSE